MDHSTGNLHGADGVELYYQRWYPDSAPRATIAMLHGLGGHSGQSTFAHLIDHLVLLGYSILGLDLRGHGRSQGRRGSISRWEDYRSDLRMLLKLISKTAPNQIIFLLGQSLGGLIALEYALHYPQDVRGVIASAPALSAPNRSPIVFAVLSVLSPIWPHLALNPNLDLSGCSRDPDEVKKLRDDPLTDPKISPRLTVEALSTVRWTQAHAADFRVPLLLLHGTADPVAPPEASQTFFRRVSRSDKTLRLYEGGFHQAFIDSNRQLVLADIAQWLDRYV
jgi:alpha-beta hydrolase superfamily lysophospholipase